MSLTSPPKMGQESILTGRAVNRNEHEVSNLDTSVYNKNTHCPVKTNFVSKVMVINAKS